MIQIFVFNEDAIKSMFSRELGFPIENIKLIPVYAYQEDLVDCPQAALRGRHFVGYHVEAES